MVSGSVVLASLGKSSNRPKAALGGAVIAACGLFVIGSAVWLMTTANFYEIVNVQIPLMWIAKPLGQSIYFMSVVILLLAMLTTAFGMGFAFCLICQSDLKCAMSTPFLCLLSESPLQHAVFQYGWPCISYFQESSVFYLFYWLFLEGFLTKIEWYNWKKNQAKSIAFFK